MALGSKQGSSDGNGVKAKYKRRSKQAKEKEERETYSQFISAQTPHQV